MPASPDEPAPAADQPQISFDGRYRVERDGQGNWHLTGPIFREGGRPGMRIPAGSPEMVEKYRDLAELLDAAVDAERKRSI